MLKIKVVIENGVVTNVLKNYDIPVDVEIINIDKDYSDRKELESYRDDLYDDPNYQEVKFANADFKDDAEDK